MVGKPNWLEEVDYIMALAKKYPVMDKDTELETVLRYKEITDLKCKEKKHYCSVKPESVVETRIEYDLSSSSSS